MSFKKITALLLVLVIMVPLTLSSCKKAPTAQSVWADGAKVLAEATGLYLEADIKLGEYSAKVNYTGNRQTGEKNYLISAGDKSMPIYTDSTKNYYTYDDYSFSVKAGEDNEMMREFMEFALTNAARLTISADAMTDAVLESTENSNKVSFKVSGETLKATFAPDEDLTFSEAAIAASFDGENKLVSLSVSTMVQGKEFYGMPLIGADKEAKALDVKFENVEINGEKAPKAPENASEYPELMALAKLYPTALFSMISDSSKTETSINLEIDLGIMKMNIGNTATATSHTLDGYTYTRTITKTVMDIMGQKETTTEDKYTDGKTGYEYYTDPEYGNYKMKIEDEDGNENTEDEIMDIFGKDTNFEDLFKNAEFAGNTLTIDLSAEYIKKLISDSEGADLGVEMDTSEITFKDTTLIIKFSNGIVESVSTELEISANADLMGTGAAVSMTITGEISIKISSPFEDFTAEAPQGYLDYEDIDDLDFEI